MVAAVHDLRDIKKGEAEREQLKMELAADLHDMERLHELSTRLIGSADLSDILEDILGATIELQKADFGNIRLVDPADGALRIIVQRGLSKSFLDHFSVSRAGDGSVCGRALEIGKRVIIEDVDKDVAFAPYRQSAKEAGYRAVQSTPITTRHGGIIGMISTHFRTPHRPSERDLRFSDLYLRIAAELIERLRTEEAIHAARRAADSANKAKSRFLAAANHDLRQPLQSIALLNGVLAQQVVNPQARLTLARLDDAIGQMTELIDSLLDLNQIENDAIKIDLTELSVPSLLSQAVSDFTPLATAKGLKLRCQPMSAVIKGDRRLLIRILSNLLSNAIKYTDKGKVLVGARRRGDTIRIEVWDTGIGIAPDRLNAVFDEFYRIRGGDTDPIGLGLGLHIVKRFAQLLGYQVEVRSVAGKGTVFSLVIPGVRFEAGTRGLPLDQDDAASSGPVILLIEDDAMQREALTSLLQLGGYRITAVGTGAAALARLRESSAFRPDVVITDFNFPDGMNGADIIRKIRDELNEEIPGLILSAQRPEAQISTRNAADLHFLSKPAKPAALLAAVEILAQRAIPDWSGRSVTERRLAVLPSTSDPLSQIAVIDDDPGIRNALHMMLEEHGYKVETFSSGEAFLSDNNHRRFRCLVVDISLPGLGGLELLKRLKSKPRCPAIIYLAGSGDVPIAVRAMREGAADFLQKPVQGQALSESIARVVKEPRPTDLPRSQVNEIVARLTTLTRREREVLNLVVKGELNKNIANDLGISQRTAEHHRHAVMRKMMAKSLAALVRMIAVAEDERA